MTDFAFNRVYSLQVFNKIDASVGTPSNGETTTTQYLVSEFNFNRITAKIRFSSESSLASSDTQEITVYNLDRETINSLRREGVKVVLRGGYKDQYPTRSPSEFPELFKGEVITVKVSRSGNDTITKILLSSAATERKQAKVHRNFSKDNTIGSVINWIAESLNITLKMDLSGKENTPIGKHRGWSGPSLEILDRLSKEFKFKAYIQNEILQVTDLSSTAAVNSLNPVIIIDNEKVKGSLSLATDYTKTEPGEESVEVEFPIFLDPKIKVGSRIRVEVEGKLGEYSVVAIVHRLDTHGSYWDTNITAEKIKNVVASYTTPVIEPNQAIV